MWAPVALIGWERQLLTRVAKLEKKGDSLGLLRLEEQALALARRLCKRDTTTTRWILNLFALCHYRTGGYGRACELHEEHRAVCEGLGDRTGVAQVCGNLGNCYLHTGDYARARELLEQCRVTAEALGDRAGVARACNGLGNCYDRTGDYVRARELYEECRAMAEAIGDRAGVAAASGNLGNCYFSTGDYARALGLHKEHRAMAEVLGDRAAVSAACGNLGNCHSSMGGYARALELHEQDKLICEELGDRAGVADACGNLGECSLNTGDYARAISHFTQQHALAQKMNICSEQADAALGVGVALRLEVRASAPGCAGSADGVREAEKWLQTAKDLGHTDARLHLARLAVDAGAEDAALAHLQTYLTWCVQRGRNQCEGCNQTRGEDAHMLTCGGCRVARFCSAEHQRMASRTVTSGRGLLEGRHKDVCGVLGKWRQRVVKEGAPPEELRAELLAFLRQ